MAEDAERDSEPPFGRCGVCGHSPVEPECPRCGVDTAKLRQLMLADLESGLHPPLKPSGIRAHMDRATRRSEEIWETLSPEFKDELLKRFRVLHHRAWRFHTCVMAPATLALYLAGFVIGASVAKWLLGWPVGFWGRWVFASALMPVVGFPLSALVEILIVEAARARDEVRLLQSVRPISLAVMKACPLPWYLKDDFWGPVTFGAATLAGLGILALAG